MPEAEAIRDRFATAHTHVLGVSVDSRSATPPGPTPRRGDLPPADFHPKGEVAKAFGVWLDDKGISDRATVIIDKDGVVRYSTSVTPAGKRDLAGLAAECEKVDAAHGGGLGDLPKIG
ncbi:MAG: redoxin domain-containing protein [Planctomycetota bacterium]